MDLEEMDKNRSHDELVELRKLDRQPKTHEFHCACGRFHSVTIQGNSYVHGSHPPKNCATEHTGVNAENANGGGDGPITDDELKAARHAIDASLQCPHIATAWNMIEDHLPIISEALTSLKALKESVGDVGDLRYSISEAQAALDASTKCLDETGLPVKVNGISQLSVARLIDFVERGLLQTPRASSGVDVEKK